MRLCVTGHHGQVASALRALHGRDGLEIVTLGRPDLDLAAADNALALMERLRPDILVSAAAYTAVDLAETEPDEARRVNAEGPGKLAAAAASLSIPVLHLSTDYVFDGRKTTPYHEADPTGPTGIYGATKLAGELAVQAANPRHVILRTAWVYSHEGKNFVRTMLRLAESRPDLGVVSDQFGCPSYAPDIAEALVPIAARVKNAPLGDPAFGVFHMAGGGDTSWAGFASAVFAHARRLGLPSAEVRPIATADYPTPATRPANSRLDGRRLATIHNIRLPHWQEGLTRCMAELARQGQ